MSFGDIKEYKMDIALGIILIIASVFLIFAVLMQSGKAKKLSGTIAGGSETFFGKQKGKKIDKLLSRMTTIVAVCFVVLVVVLYVAQDKPLRDTRNEVMNEALGETEIVEEAEK